MNFKKHIRKRKKTLFQWILKNILQNQAFQKTAKFVQVKGTVILVKVDETYNILKRLLATGYWSRHEGGIGWSMFFAGAEIWFITLWLKTIQISGSTYFIQDSHINVSPKYVLSKRMHFQHIFFSRKLQQIRHVICQRNRWKIAKHIVAGVYIFMLLYL